MLDSDDDLNVDEATVGTESTNEDTIAEANSNCGAVEEIVELSNSEPNENDFDSDINLCSISDHYDKDQDVFVGPSSNRKCLKRRRIFTEDSESE